MENPTKKLSPWPRRFELSIEILKIIAGGSLILASLVAPNLAQVLPLLGLDPRRRERPYRVSDLSRALKNLQKAQYVAKVRTDGSIALRLTKRGTLALARFEMNKFRLKNPENWARRAS